MQVLCYCGTRILSLFQRTSPPNKISIKMSGAILKFNRYLTQCNIMKNPVLIVGQKHILSSLPFSEIQIKLLPKVTEETFNSAINFLNSSSRDSCSLYLNQATVACLPKGCSRHNTPSQAHCLTKIIKNEYSGNDDHIVIICEYKNVLASACAIARAFPLYFCKSKDVHNSPNTVTIEFLITNKDCTQFASLSEADIECLMNVSEGVRLAARIVDTPCNKMHTQTFLQEIIKVGEALNIMPEIIQGEELKTRGFGGIYAVGQAAIHPPALAVLSHNVPNSRERIAWVGKGIVYDTGGLCIKSKTSMSGMKRDCGGAAAILGAFYATVKLGFQENLDAIFCLAENAIGPKAIKPDDIITLYSGKTIEINNTDAEGRLVLGDGVSYARTKLKSSIILDMATLTGAQGSATGRYHAALLSNNEEWEKATVVAGRASGDLVHPMPYCPEIHFNEFGSCIADMKNSVGDRSNAQTSCAGLFINAQLGFEYTGAWIHIDMASPVHQGDRATGYGVALLTTLFGHSSSNPMLQFLSPHEIQVNDLGSANKKIRLE